MAQHAQEPQGNDLNLANAEDDDFRRSMDEAWAKWSDDRPVSELAQALADPDAERRAHAAALLRLRGTEAAPAIPALRQALRDPDENARFEAALALAEVEHHATEALPELMETANGDACGDVRGAATHAIFRLGIVADIRAARSTLLARLHDDVPTARYNACWGLSGFGADAADTLPELIARLGSDPHPVVRAAAAHTMRCIGAPASPALPALHHALHDPNADVRAWAMRAITTITGAPPRKAAT